MAENDIQLNDVIEFIGIYTFDPEVTVHQSNDGDEVPFGLMEDISVQLPPSEVKIFQIAISEKIKHFKIIIAEFEVIFQIPRLHCIACQKLSLQDLVSRSCAIEVIFSETLKIFRGIKWHLKFRSQSAL